LFDVKYRIREIDVNFNNACPNLDLFYLNVVVDKDEFLHWKKNWNDDSGEKRFNCVFLERIVKSAAILIFEDNFFVFGSMSYS
jgi:hypothetical protein